MRRLNAKLLRLALVATTLVAGVGLTIELLSTASAAPPPVAPATAAPAFTGKLENGVSVELLGLIRGKMVKTWWLPDGTPDDHPILAKARFDRTKVIHAPENKDPRPTAGVVVRFNLKMGDGSMASSDSEQWFCTALDAQDKPIDDLVVLYVGSERVKTKDVRFDFATGPWEPTDIRATEEELGGIKGEVRFSKAESLRDGTYVGLFVDNDRWVRISGQGIKRLCARDAAGKTHVAIPFQGRFTGEGPPVEPLELGYLFADLAPGDLKEVWLERRIVDKWIEFRDVSFEPGVKTEVRVVTSDDPPDDVGGEGL